MNEIYEVVGDRCTLSDLLLSCACVGLFESASEVYTQYAFAFIHSVHGTMRVTEKKAG